jgi:hypothetical protein
MGERKWCHLVQQECPTIPNTKMPRGNSDIFGDTREKERTGENLIRLGRYPGGFYGTSPLFENPLPIINGALAYRSVS